VTASLRALTEPRPQGARAESHFPHPVRSCSLLPDTNRRYSPSPISPKRSASPRQTLNNLVNAKGGISAEMAVRLAKGLSSTPDFWLRLQMN
jgi:hypothetical protein